MPKPEDWLFAVFQPGKKRLGHFKTYEDAVRCQESMRSLGAPDVRIYDRSEGETESVMISLTSTRNAGEAIAALL
jgi:hypothetical protein